MMKRTKVYFDMEFTGLHQNTTLISLGMVSEHGGKYYAEFCDYDEAQIDAWLQENAINNLTNKGEGLSNDIDYTYGTKSAVAQTARDWLSQFQLVEMWSDCGAFDWMLFCQLFEHAFNIPNNVYYTPFDLSTAFKIKGVDPDVNREEFALMNGANPDSIPKHNALWDAEVIRACHERLMKDPEPVEY